MTQLDDEQSIVRYCKPSQLSEHDQQTPTAQAFLLRTFPNEEKEEYLSVDWLEYFKAEQIGLIPRRADICAALKGRLTIKKSGRLAALRVGDIRNENANLKAMNKKGSYSCLFGYLPEQEEIAELLSQLVYDHCESSE